MTKSYYEMMAELDLDRVQDAVNEATEQSITSKKLNRLAERTQEKSNKLGLSLDRESNGTLLGTITGEKVYDADSPYNTIMPDNSKSTLRLGDIDSSKANYVNAPESPETIMKKFNRPATEEEIAAFRASLIAKDNFAMGTTPASNEAWADIRENPLSEEDWKLYQQYMNPALAEFGKIDLVGKEGKVGDYGRQVVQGYNPDAPNPAESLQDRLITTGNAEIHSYGKPVNFSENRSTFASMTPEQRLETFNKMDQEFKKKDEGGIANALAGFAYMLTEGVANTADLVPEVVEYAYGNMVGDKKWSDVEGFYGSQESKAFKEWLGYNDEVVNKLGKEAAESVKNAWENGDYWGVVKTLGNAATTPELLTTSLGYVAGMVIPGAAAQRAVRLVSGVQKKAKSLMASGIDKATAYAEAEKKAGVGYKIAKITAGQVGYVAEAEQFGRDAEELYRETYNEEMPDWQKGAARVGGMLYAKMDATVAKAILLGKDPVAKAVPEMVKSLPDVMKANLAGKIAVLSGATVAKVAGAFGLEGSTEAIQTAMEKIAGKYKEGEVGVADVVEEEKYEIGGAAVLGGAGGTQMQVAGATPEALKKVPDLVEAGREAVEKATETETQKATRENREFSEPIKAEILDNLVRGESSKVAENVEKIHGKLGDLDTSAPKSQTYANVMRKALNTAIGAQEEKAVANVYKVMAELDADENVDFSIRDVVYERSYEATKEFLKIINDTNLSANERMDKIKEKGTKVVEDLDAKANVSDNILKDVERLKVSLEQELKNAKSVMGSEEFDKNTESLQKLIGTIENYLENKDASAVNKEMMELGFIEKDASGTGLNINPSKPGLNTYRVELKRVMLNPETNKNLLNKKVIGSGAVSLTNLKKFAASRLNKLNPKGNNVSYQAEKLIDSLKTENESMSEVILELIETASNIDVPQDVKDSYIAELQEAAKAVLEADKELDRRQQILEGLEKPKNGGAYAFEVDSKGNESIQLLKGKDKTKVADIVDGVVQGLESKVEQADDIAVQEEPVKQPETKGKSSKDLLSNQSITDKRVTKEEFEAEAKFEEKPEVIEEAEETPSTMESIRSKIAEFDEALSELTKDVDDMDLKAAVKNFYNTKLNEIGKDRDKLNSLLKRMEKVLDKRIDRLESKEEMSTFGKIVAYADRLVKSMLVKLAELKDRIQFNREKYNSTKKQLDTLLKMIDKLESEYEPEIEKTAVGSIKKYRKSPYGPMVELNGKRVKGVEKTDKKTGEPYAVLSEAMETLTNEKITELDKEGTLGAKLTKRLIENGLFKKLGIRKIISKGQDNIFGKMDSTMFSNPKKLIENLPKNFKDIFMNEEDSKKDLLENFKTMNEYIQNTNMGEIVITEEALEKVINSQGLAVKSVPLYGPVNRQLVFGDKLRNKSTKKVISLTKGLKNLPKNLNDYELQTGETSLIVNSMLELLGTVKDGRLEIDEQTETILKFYSAKLLADTQSMIGNILSMDEAEMSKYLGITDPDEQLQVREDAQNGLVSAASVRSSIGTEVYQALGIKFNSSTPELTEEAFKASLGMLVQNMSIDNGILEVDKRESADKTQLKIGVNWENVSTDKVALIKSVAKLQYLNENRSRPLPSKKVPADKDRFVMNTKNPVDEADNTKLNELEKIPYTISSRLKAWLEMDETEALKAMGYIDVESSGLHISEQSAQEARNDKLVREWEILKAFAKGIGKNKFYLNWGQTVSGRFTILNDIQYQESKLHREFVVAEGSEVEVNPTKADDVEMLKASILQGLDMDPDKLSKETATANFDAMFKVTDKGIEVSKDGAVKNAYEAFRNGKVDAEAMGEVFADSEGHHGISSIELLVEWDKAIKAGNKPFKTHANLEIDAITSGMILTLLQIGSDQAIRLAEKGGIYTEERMPKLEAYVKEWLGKDVEFTPGALIEAGKAHAKTIEDKMANAKTKAEKAKLRKELESDDVFKDLYSTIGVAMIGEVEAHKEKLLAKAEKTESELRQLAMLEKVGDLNLKNIRSIAKSPVMVYIYGATIKSIKSKLTFSLGIDTLVKTIKRASEKLKNGEKADDEQAFIDMFIPNPSYKDRYGKKIENLDEMSEWEKLLHIELSKDVISTVDTTINKTFGKSIETAFESRLGFVDRNRNTVKTLEMLTFEAYKVRLADKIKVKLDEIYDGRHNGEQFKLSKEQLNDINQELTKEGFGHNIVWNRKDGAVVNQSLNKTKTKGGEHSSTVQVGNTKHSGQIKERVAEVNTGAAATIPIHAIDGRMILDTLTRELNVKYAGGNVYDAVVLSLDKAMLNDTADFYNNGMIETGFDRSIVAEQLEVLENMLSTMSDEQKVKMADAIGVRGNEDYVKESDRLKFTLGKMLESIELSEEVNKARLENSSKGYYSGHLFQMGSGVTKIEAGEVRAKEFKNVDTIKRMLAKKQQKDREATAKEFKGLVKGKPDYVLNLRDVYEGTEIKSNANLAELTPNEKYLSVRNSRIDALSSKDVVEIVGNVRLDNINPKHAKKLMQLKGQILATNAGIVDSKVIAEEMKQSGRELVNGVWVKQPKKAEMKPEEDIIETTFKNTSEMIDKVLGKDSKIPESVRNRIRKVINDLYNEKGGTDNKQYNTRLKEIIEKWCK